MKQTSVEITCHNDHLKSYFMYQKDILVYVRINILCEQRSTHVHFSKKEPDLLGKCIPCLQILLQDENVNVQKKTILVLPNIYKIIVQWLIKSKPGNDEEKSFVLESMKSMKNKMYELIDSENDG